LHANECISLLPRRPHAPKPLSLSDLPRPASSPPSLSAGTHGTLRWSPDTDGPKCGNNRLCDVLSQRRQTHTTCGSSLASSLQLIRRWMSSTNAFTTSRRRVEYGLTMRLQPAFEGVAVRCLLPGVPSVGPVQVRLLAAPDQLKRGLFVRVGSRCIVSTRCRQAAGS